MFSPSEKKPVCDITEVENSQTIGVWQSARHSTSLVEFDERMAWVTARLLFRTATVAPLIH